MRIKKGDRVIVIAGKDKGRVGKVLAAYPREDKVLIEGINRVTKHTKAGQTPRGTRTGGIEHKEAPVHVSTVMLAVEVDGKTVGSRVGYRVDESGTKVRFAKRTGEEI